jgi:hypothetical protein
MKSVIIELTEIDKINRALLRVANKGNGWRFIYVPLLLKRREWLFERMLGEI